MRVLNQPLAFVDIETSGANFKNGRIIEIGIVRVEGTAVSTYQTLICPGRPLPEFITSLTGLTDAELAAAPSFGEVADDIAEWLDGAIFVAHNVRFDYSFVTHEFRRLGIPYRPKTLCTVRLSRALYPSYRGHSLDKLIQRFEFAPESRHRALADAKVLWEFVQRACGEFGRGFVDEVMAQLLQKQSLPKALKPELIDRLPQSPGVYIFEDQAGAPIYVGKSVDIRSRVLSHFTADIEAVKELKMAQLVHNISWHQTAGELGALLLENHLIKELKPVFNSMLRRHYTMLGLVAVANARGYLRVERRRLNEAEIPTLEGQLIGVFRSDRSARERLAKVTKDFGLCHKLTGLEKGSGPCFGYHLHSCHGACVEVEPADQYNQRFQAAFSGYGVDDWPFAGPVLISEADGSRRQGHFVDRWQVLGQVTEDEDGLLNYHDSPVPFELDSYKILKRFLADKRNRSRIKPLSLAGWRQLIGA